VTALEFARTGTLLWIAAAVLFVIAAIAALAEHRRTRRRNLDRVGWVPWNAIQVLAFIGSVLALALALKAR
jgi:membrane-anchored protein YejM (alkaline phosphatase superfamily)